MKDNLNIFIYGFRLFIIEKYEKQNCNFDQNMHPEKSVNKRKEIFLYLQHVYCTVSCNHSLYDYLACTYEMRK